MPTISRQMKKLLEDETELLHTLRDKSKTEGGRLTGFGKELLLLCADNDVQPATIAKILDITSAAVSQNISRREGDNS